MVNSIFELNGQEEGGYLWVSYGLFFVAMGGRLASEGMVKHPPGGGSGSGARRLDF